MLGWGVKLPLLNKITKRGILLTGLPFKAKDLQELSAKVGLITNIFAHEWSFLKTGKSRSQINSLSTRQRKILTA